MRMKPLGHTGLEVSSVGLGCMNFGMMNDQAETNDVVNAAIDVGVNFFDVADIYGGTHGRAEAMLGKALGNRRHEVIVATKWGLKRGGSGPAERGGSADYINAAVERSLELLGTDYIDLYQHHMPDGDTPIDETLGALQKLIDSGQVRHVGCSNYSGAQLGEAEAVDGTARYATAQNRYSLLHRDIESDLVPVATPLNVGILPYFPLESGLLTGKYKRDIAPPPDTRFGKWGGGGTFASDERYARVDALSAYGESIGRNMLDIAIGWLAAQPFVSSVIAGVTKPEQIVQNVAAADWEPTPDEMRAIGEIASLRSR